MVTAEFRTLIDAGAVRCIIVSDADHCASDKTRRNACPLCLCRRQRSERHRAFMNIQTPERNMDGFLPNLPIYPSDIVCRSLVSGIEQSAEPRQRGVLQRAIGQWGTRWLGFLLFPVLALVCLITVWFGGTFLDWMYYWMLLGTALLTQVILLVSIWYARRQERRAPGGISAPGQVSVRSLSQGALAGDDGLAPPIALFPDGQASPSTVAFPTSFKVSSPGSRLLRGQQIMSGISLGLSVGVAAMFVTLFIAEQTLFAQSYLPWQLFGIYFLFFFLSGLRFISITRKVRAIRVETRADGLHWRNQTLPWSQVRGWYVFTMNPVRISKPRPNIIYALVGEHISLIWLTYPPFMRPEDPGQQLAQSVHDHVNLPLRDLNPGALHISYEVWGLPSWRNSRLLAASAWHVGEAPLPRWPAAMFGAVLSVLVLLGGILTPPAQQWYFGGQLTRLETATTRISDPLTANTLQWTPTSDDASSDFVFTPEGYVYQPTTCCNAASLMAQSMNNGLVEVTMRQQVDFDLSDAGILFRANSASNTALAFTITPNGEWHLDLLPKQGEGSVSDYRSLLYEGVIGGVSAIHQGLDATNRLAVLMQGSSLTFFVNGQYVGRYVGNDVPQSGQVGVFVGSADGPVTFSDLLIASA